MTTYMLTAALLAGSAATGLWVATFARRNPGSAIFFGFFGALLLALIALGCLIDVLQHGMSGPLDVLGSLFVGFTLVVTGAFMLPFALSGQRV